MKNDGKLSIPAGIESYSRIVTGCYYVDKTLLIKKLIDDSSVKVTVFIRPRRFGKTLNLDMLKVFFEKTSKDTSIYFKDKLIWKSEARYQKEQGKHPVIFLTFKDSIGSSFEEAIEKFKQTIQMEYIRHLPEVENSSISGEEKAEYSKMIGKEITLSDLKKSIFFLSYILRSIYKEKVVLLIDEYDTPIRYSFIHNYSNKMIKFMNDMLSIVFKTNESNLFVGVLSGILNQFGKNMLDGLNNVNVDSVLDDNYSSFFGFTEDEVKAMLSYYGFENKYEEIKNWYDGYKFGNTTIYSPWSVVKCLRNDCKTKPYWVDTANNSLIGEIISKANESEIRDLEKLYKGETVFSNIETEITYKNMISSESSVLSFLLLAGYLTTTGTEDEFGLKGIVIPNREIKGLYKEEILSGLFKIPTDSSLPIFFLNLYCMEIAWKLKISF